MRLQSVTVYRIYITTSNNDFIDNTILKLKRKYGASKVILRKSRNVRDFMYIEIETSKTDSKEEIEKTLKEEGIEQVKIDVIELKKPL